MKRKYWFSLSKILLFIIIYLILIVSFALACFSLNFFFKPFISFGFRFCFINWYIYMLIFSPLHSVLNFFRLILFLAVCFFSLLVVIVLFLPTRCRVWNSSFHKFFTPNTSCITRKSLLVLLSELFVKLLVFSETLKIITLRAFLSISFCSYSA